MPAPIQITAAVTAEDVRREFYEDANPMWWITEMVMDPPQLIVRDESTGDLYRIPFSISGNLITFEEEIEVDVEYVDSPPESETVPATASAPTRVVLAGAAERTFRREIPSTYTKGGTLPVKPEPAPEPVKPTPPPAEPVTAAKAVARIHGAPIHTGRNNVEFTEAQLAELRKTLGLADNDELTPEGVLAASSRLADHRAEIAAAGPNTIIVDASVWQDMQTRITRGEDARRIQLENERDNILNAAMGAGKFPPARLPQWQRVWASDPDGTKALIASLHPGLVPTSEIGYPGDPEAFNGGEFESIFPPQSAHADGR